MIDSVVDLAHRDIRNGVDVGACGHARGPEPSPIGGDGSIDLVADERSVRERGELCKGENTEGCLFRVMVDTPRAILVL